MDVSVHAFRIMGMPLEEMTDEHTSIFFILTNSLNNILDSVQDSTSAILSETENISNTVSRILLFLLIFATFSLFISVCVVFPVATKVDKNKDELLHHFMLIERDDVKK